MGSCHQVMRSAYVSECDFEDRPRSGLARNLVHRPAIGTVINWTSCTHDVERNFEILHLTQCPRNAKLDFLARPVLNAHPVDFHEAAHHHQWAFDNIS
jgi:hypothetical protein